MNHLIVTCSFMAVLVPSFVYSIAQGIRAKTPEAISHGIRGSMHLAMLGMSLPGEALFFPLFQMAFFFLAALWFLIRASIRHKSLGTWRGGHGIIRDVSSAGMMGAMVCMVAMMCFMGSALESSSGPAFTNNFPWHVHGSWVHPSSMGGLSSGTRALLAMAAPLAAVFYGLVVGHIIGFVLRARSGGGELTLPNVGRLLMELGGMLTMATMFFSMS